MLYDLNTVLAHSAKGTTWKNHKYFKKVGNRYYYSHDIKAARNKMKAADQYNMSTRSALKRYQKGMKNVTKRANKGYNITADEYYVDKRYLDDLSAAKEKYDNAVSRENRYKEYENGLRTKLAKATLAVLNGSAAFSDAVNKGKKVIWKLFGK